MFVRASKGVLFKGVLLTATEFILLDDTILGDVAERLRGMDAVAEINRPKRPEVFICDADNAIYAHIYPYVVLGKRSTKHIRAKFAAVVQVEAFGRLLYHKWREVLDEPLNGLDVHELVNIYDRDEKVLGYDSDVGRSLT